MFKYMSAEINDYKRFKTELDIALTNTASNMVRVGFLLLQARDTEILKESGYTGMGDFAQKEYGLSPDQTSRFIGIAEKFGDGEGRLAEQWQQYGYTKLSEMLTIPDKVAEAIPAEITREEIREIKAEVKAEQEITPIEAEIERVEEKLKTPESQRDWTTLNKFFFSFFRERPQDFFKAFTLDWAKKYGDPEDKEVVMEAFAPSGIGVLEAKIPGEGRYILSIQGEDTKPKLVSVRGNSSEEVAWSEIRNGFGDLEEQTERNFELKKDDEIKDMWQQLYGQPFPETEEEKPEKKVKIAPAQDAKTRKTSPKDKDGKIEKAMNPPVTEDKKPETRISSPKDKKPENEKAELERETESEDPESRISERSGEDPEEDIGEDFDNRPKEEIEKELKETLKNVKRGNVQLAEAAGRIERLDDHKTWLYIEELTFNTDELWRKIKTDLQIITALKKSLEIRFPENEEGEDEP